MKNGIRIHYSTLLLAVLLLAGWILIAIPRADGEFAPINMHHADDYAAGNFTTYQCGWPFAHYEIADFGGFELRDWTVPLTKTSARHQLYCACRKIRAAEVTKCWGPLERTIYIDSMEWHMLQNPRFGPVWLRTERWRLFGSDYSRIQWLGLVANLGILSILIVTPCSLFEFRMRLSRGVSLKELFLAATIFCLIAAWWGNARRLQNLADPDQLRSAELTIHAPNWLVRLVGTKPLRAFLRPVPEQHFENLRVGVDECRPRRLGGT